MIEMQMEMERDRGRLGRKEGKKGEKERTISHCWNSWQNVNGICGWLCCIDINFLIGKLVGWL